MVAPFKSYSKVISMDRKFYLPGGVYTFNVYNLSASGTNQVPPYNNTPYNCTVSKTLVGPTHCTNWNADYQDMVDSVTTVAINMARAKMIGELGESSQLGSTLTAERKQTFNLLTTTATRALLAAHAVKKGDLLKAARLLGVKPPAERTRVILRSRKGRSRRITRNFLVLPNGREVAKSLGNKWLWWSYGVKPLVEDSYNMIDVLQRDIPWTRVEGLGYADNKIVRVGWSQSEFLLKCRLRMAINVRLENPNLFLANQLGLTNPLQWFVEGIPGSFVIDWFSNLSQVISQFTDFTGLETSDPMTSKRTSWHYSQYDRVGSNPKGVLGLEVNREFFTRELSIPPAKLRFAYERFNWQRGANAISLLVQGLTTKAR